MRGRPFSWTAAPRFVVAKQALAQKREPWDADAYWYLWYPISCFLAAVAGISFRKNGWLAGGIITFSQLPILWLNNGEGSLMAVGLLFLTLLAVPTVALSTLTGWCAVRVRSA